MVDVSVVNVASCGYAAGNRTVKAVMDKRVADKVKKCKALAAAEDCIFKALVFDSYGSVGAGTKELLHSLAEARDDAPEVADAAYLDSLRMLSFALQRGNAHVSARGCELVRAAPPTARARARAA